MNAKRTIAALAAAFVGGCTCVTENDQKPAAAEQEKTRTVKVVNLDPEAKPIRDISASTASPIVGYAGSLLGKDYYEGAENRERTARVFRQAGARFVRQWDAVNSWQLGAGATLAGRAGDAKNPLRIADPSKVTDMKNVFSFYKEYGVKVMLTLENWGVFTNLQTFARSGEKEDVRRVICDYVQWIVDNGFCDVVAGLELGNEPYWQGADLSKESNSPERYAEKWIPVVEGIKKIWPKAPIGLTIAEYFANDPDIAAVRNRSLSTGKLVGEGYFSASGLNQWSGRYILAMKPVLDKIDHVIYHSYGAETPYSATYDGVIRYRRFTEAFPELKGKRFWITEWRDRSDEDNWSHQRFRETLAKSGYMMMMVAQPDVDALNLHEFSSLSGGIYAAAPGKQNKDGTWSDGTWAIQWDGHANWRPNFDDVHRSDIEPGGMGPAMRLLAESFRREPLVMDFGSEKYGAYSEGKSNAVWACSDYYNDVFHRFRQELRKGKAWDEIAPAGDDCEYIVTMGKSRRYVTFLAVNYKPTETEFVLRLPLQWNARPHEYRVYSCPEQFLDVNEIPGEPRFTRRLAYQTFLPNSFWHQRVIAGPTVLRIPPNSVTAVRIPIEKRSLSQTAKDLIDEAVLLGKQGGAQFCVYKDGREIVNVCGGTLSTNANAAAVTKTTLFPIFSTEKPLLATAVHRAVEQGKMDYSKPLCTWWPEFTGKGKERLTLGETLGYRSGMNGNRPWAFTKNSEMADWEKTVAAAAAEDPELEPGTRQRYMPISYAWMIGHPLEVAMGKPLKQVLDEEVLVPAGITNDFYFANGEDVDPRVATFYKSSFCEVMNEPWARRACIPSAYAVASAQGIARFYNRLCGFDGKAPLIKKETLDNALKPSRHASDPLPSAESMKKDWHMIFGMGYGLWGDADRMDRVFGHGGAGGSEALVDRDQKLVVAFTCNFEDSYTYEVLRKQLYELVGLRWRYWTKPADIQAIQMKSAK